LHKSVFKKSREKTGKNKIALNHFILAVPKGLRGELRAKFRCYIYGTGECGDNPECTWHTDGSAKTKLLDAVDLNGSGRNSNGDFLTLPRACSGNRPPSCIRGFRNIQTQQPCGSCRYPPIEDLTVARDENNPYLDCGSTVFIYDTVMHGDYHGIIRVVGDKGTFDPENNLDHFAGILGCNKAIDLFNSEPRMVIILY